MPLHGRYARVQLTHVSSEDVAVNAAQETHLVGVNAPSIRPVSNRTQAQLKVVHTCKQRMRIVMLRRSGVGVRADTMDTVQCMMMVHLRQAGH
jgi:hypothetical protein